MKTDVLLGDHITTQKGYAFKSRWYTKEGQPIVKVSNFTDNSIDTSELVCVPQEIADEYKKYELKTHDIVIQTVGSWPSNPASVVGKTIRVPNSANGVLLNQNAVKIEPEEGLDKGYLYYLLKDNTFKEFIVGTAQGAASQASITLDSIRAFKFKRPSIDIQERIAEALTTFDQLIENNNRRIAILEKIAQSLYQEWFVKYQFPQHKCTKFVDSTLGKIPQGWEVIKLENACESLNDGDWIETKDQGGDDYRLLQVSNIGLGKFIETVNHRYITKETFTRLRCTEIVPGDILISRMPNPTGRAWLTSVMPWKMITAVDVAIAKPNFDKTNEYFLVEFLNSPRTLEMVKKQQTGTTRPRISRSNLGLLELVLPDKELQELFKEYVEPVYRKINLLTMQCLKLKSQRDLILPKLISGSVKI